MLWVNMSPGVRIGSGSDRMNRDGSLGRRLGPD